MLLSLNSLAATGGLKRRKPEDNVPLYVDSRIKTGVLRSRLSTAIRLKDWKGEKPGDSVSLQLSSPTTGGRRAWEQRVPARQQS